MNEKMERMLERMVDNFNFYSRTVAWSCAEDKEELRQWYLGKMNCIEEYMEELAKVMGVKLKYGWGFEVYGRGEKWEQELRYRTVEIVKEG